MPSSPLSKVSIQKVLGEMKNSRIFSQNAIQKCSKHTTESFWTSTTTRKLSIKVNSPNFFPTPISTRVISLVLLIAPISLLVVGIYSSRKKAFYRQNFSLSNLAASSLSPSAHLKILYFHVVVVGLMMMVEHEFYSQHLLIVILWFVICVRRCRRLCSELSFHSPSWTSAHRHRRQHVG